MIVQLLGRTKERTHLIKNALDRPCKNPSQKFRRKAAIPIVVSKESAERELQFSREKWLKMDPATLGGRLLDHLTELEYQRSRCSNISGRVAGRMKDSKFIATEITKAMIKKLTTVGDVFTLRNENFSLKEELNKIERKEQAQNKEIQDLRKMISNLEREVRSLKEGFGPFPTVSTISSPRQKRTKTVKKSLISEKKTEERRGLDSPFPIQQQEETGCAMVNPFLVIFLAAQRI